MGYPKKPVVLVVDDTIANIRILDDPPDGSEGFARGRVVLPDEQEAFAQRRLQLADIQIFSGGGNAQRGFGVRGDGLPCRRKDTLGRCNVAV